MTTRRLLLAVSVIFALLAGNAEAATFYVSPDGSDSNPGNSASNPWRTVARANNASLAPGDTVLFQGGQTFADSTLMPTASGTPGAPITFSSYGSGRATISNASGAVWFSGKSYLTFDNLVLTTGGADAVILAGSSGASSYVTVRRSLLMNSGYSGINVPNTADNHWLIEDNTISHVGDSGLLILGSDVTVRGNTITDTGWNPALNYGKHGIYAKGPGMTIANNDISLDQNGSGITLRYHGARVYGNSIHDTPRAFSYFPDDPAAGTIAVYGNRAWGITGFAFYYAGNTSTVDLVLANNTFQLDHASEAVNVSEAVNANVTVANNIFTGSYGSALRAPTPVAGKVFAEHHNDWSGAGWNIPSGVGDLRVDPGLSAPSALAPSAASPVVDRGSASVTGLSFAAACDGQALHYCGLAPDMGASELASDPLSGDVSAPSTPASLRVTSADVTSISLAWTASSDNTGVAGYDVFLDGAKATSVSSAAATVAGLPCGRTYTVGVQAFDAAGNRSATASMSGSTAGCPASAPPVVDTTPPTLSVSARSVGKTLTVQATAADSSGIRQLRFLLNGRSVCLVSASTGSCRMSLAGSGRNTVTVEATDNAGNVASTSISIGSTRVSARQLAVHRSTSTSVAIVRRHVGRRT